MPVPAKYKLNLFRGYILISMRWNNLNYGYFLFFMHKKYPCSFIQKSILTFLLESFIKNYISKIISKIILIVIARQKKKNIFMILYDLCNNWILLQAAKAGISCARILLLLLSTSAAKTWKDISLQEIL